MAPVYCECGHKIRCEVRREGERLGTLVSFDAEKPSGTHDEWVTYCPGAASGSGPTSS